jgi:hypothetical protein
VDTGAAQTASRMSPSRVKSLRRGNLSAFLLLLIQYGVGMYVALYVNVPAADKGSGLGKAIGNGPALLTIHILLGLLLILSAIGVLVQAVLARHPVLIAAAVIGLIAMIGAAFEGSRFVSSLQDSASLGMAILTGVGLLCFGGSMYLLSAPRLR